MTKLTRIEVNCEAAGLPPPEMVEEVQKEALALLQAGDAERARNVLEQTALIETRREELGPVEQILELTDEEREQHAADQETGRALQADLFRAQRNSLLAGSDWTQLPDVPEKTRERWAKYRQELRDLTFEDEPRWPKPPA